MPSGALLSSAKPDNPANGLDPLQPRAQLLLARCAVVFGVCVLIEHPQSPISDGAYWSLFLGHLDPVVDLVVAERHLIAFKNEVNPFPANVFS